METANDRGFDGKQKTFTEAKKLASLLSPQKLHWIAIDVEDSLRRAGRIEESAIVAELRERLGERPALTETPN